MNILKLMVIFITISFFNSIHAQTTELTNNAKGIWKLPHQTEDADFEWKAQWIWMPDNDSSTVMLARKSFHLSTVSDNTLLRITASSKYELFINEKAICQGPARSAPHHQSYDILDISKVLNLGENTIAIRVHHQKEKISYHLKGRAGLLVQLDIDNTTTLVSDNTWKTHHDPTWNHNEITTNRFQMAVNDDVDFRNNLGSWKSLNFDDSNWKQAKPLLRNSGWPAPKKTDKATTLTTPWTSLVPRDIPYLIESDKEAINLIEAREISSEEYKMLFSKTGLDITEKIDAAVIDSNGKIRLDKTEKHWFLLYDFGEVINGMPKLKLKGSSGSEVHILSAPYMIGNNFTHKIVASNFHDKITLSGQVDDWQATYFKPCRYLAIVVSENSEPIKLDYIGIHQIQYPFSKKGELSTPEAPWLEDLWNASAKTIDVCTTDAFTDNYREKRQYAQTGYYAALGNYYTFGDYALQRRYLIQVAQEQEANGLMPAYAPLARDDFMIILDSNCLWIRSLYNYYLYSGDEKTVRELLPSAQKLMDLLHSFTDATGMINNPPYSYWLDHTLNDRRGANTTLNGHYLGALKDFSKVLEWLNLSDSNLYKNRASKLSMSVQKLLWDDAKGLFSDALVDGKRSNQFSEHANAMALAENIATTEQAEKIISQLLEKDTHNFIKRANGITMVSPAMSYFLHKGIANYSYEKESLELLYAKFSQMLSEDTNGTLWEEWWRNGTGRTGKFQERTRSDAQTESVFPPALIARYILGLKVNKPGMEEIIISRPNTELTQIKASIPCPQGVLEIEWNFREPNLLRLSIPENIHINLDLESLTESQNKILINGQVVTVESNNSNFYIFNSGTFEISF